ncbi:hypothetical protein [Agrobacterium sp.]|uniref:hypothetical protein n=1 Tax=Agrobacterium sp. TaxID=361 RepID=UPI0040380767
MVGFVKFQELKYLILREKGIGPNYPIVCFQCKAARSALVEVDNSGHVILLLAINKAIASTGCQTANRLGMAGHCCISWHSVGHLTKPPSYYDGVVDGCEELVKFALLAMAASAYLTDR